MDRKNANRSYRGDTRRPDDRGPSNKRRIPAPPVDRDEVSYERVGSDQSPRGSRDSGHRDDIDIDVTDVKFVGASGDTIRKLQKRLVEAAGAFEAERFSEALRLLQSIDKLAPDTIEVLELKGLAQYRLGKWAPAIKDLERFSSITQSLDQAPILADCYRAKREWAKVEDIWLELGDASPASETVEEGRIVYAGALADQGKLRDAIRILETAPRAPRRPKVQHLRRWYALADLYERAGDVAKARRLFSEIGTLSPDFGDANARASSLK